MTMRIKNAVCVTCNRLVDGVSGLFGAIVPEPDDVTVCAYCAEIMQFNSDMTLRKADEDARKETEVFTDQIIEALKNERF